MTCRSQMYKKCAKSIKKGPKYHNLCRTTVLEEKRSKIQSLNIKSSKFGKKVIINYEEMHLKCRLNIRNNRYLCLKYPIIDHRGPVA